MIYLSLPSVWKGLYMPPELNKNDFKFNHKGFSFSGTYTIEEDEGFPPAIKIEILHIGTSKKDALAIVDPAITYWLADAIRERL